MIVFYEYFSNWKRSTPTNVCAATAAAASKERRDATDTANNLNGGSGNSACEQK
ncbi:hypothetical protein TcasGA2_TC002701 [Tribolium castaneum]|uniref:Uncharacterized protein n=1 Tax=Tribolium castaneum TaxID=7070 RepID=D6WDW4_TRICA|nr:hypothetical protein TcasGA2_TC002701 [Tribolium castaneum]